MPLPGSLSDFYTTDGFSYHEIEIPLQAIKNEGDKSVLRGYLDIDAADIYAAQVLDGPPGVKCVYQTAPPRGSMIFRAVGPFIFKSDEVEHCTTPPIDVVRIKCFVNDDEESKRSYDRPHLFPLFIGVPNFTIPDIEDSL